MSRVAVEVDVREVGPRDGLQAESPVPVADRVRLIAALLDAGVTHIEACSFVSPKAVPSMAGAAEVVAAVGDRPGVRLVALVPNLRGAELARDAGVRELSATISASPAYNEKNVRMTVDESVAALESICALGLPVDAVVSCAFGSPYEGEIAPGSVAGLAARLLSVGCASLTLADTTGMATPRRVREVLELVGVDVGLHLHETRGTGLVNAFAAWELGVRRFDTSVGGLGGSPFAAGAAGNLATEDLVHLFDDLGVSTGIDLDRLLHASALAAEIVGHPVPSRIALAGPRTRLSST
jgi:hydroxymethylglutaryl-CoA lyase